MSFAIAFVGFAALIVLHELGHFAAAKAVGMRVERFALFLGPMLVSIKRGETEYGIAAIPLGGYVKISGMNPEEELPPEVQHRAYYKQPPWKRIVVILAGPAMNLLVAFLIFGGLLVLRGTPTDASTARVDSLNDGSPAAQVLREGDEVVAVDGVVGSTTVLRRQIASHTCSGRAVEGCRAATPAQVTFVRDGVRKTVGLTPVYSAETKRPLVGLAFTPVLETQGIVEGAGNSVTIMWEVTKTTVDRLSRIFFDAEARKEVSGPVGSFETTRQVVIEFGFIDALNILGIISLSLAIVNLFPFLPLDGGHVFWAVAEKLRGRAIPFAVLERVSVFGFMLVMALFFIGFTNDIGRLQGEGFQVR